MPVKKALLKKIGFTPTDAAITLEAQRLSYKLSTGAGIGRAGVYLIVVTENESDNVDVLYVGKAGRGLNTRLRQHEGGYQRKLASDPNYPGSSLQLKMLELGITNVEIWFRESRVRSINEYFEDAFINPPLISLFSLEEEALIVYFKMINEPLVNSAFPPATVNEGVAEVAEVAEVDATPFPEGDHNCLNEITNQISQNSPELLDLWLNQIQKWSVQTKNNFSEALRVLRGNAVLQGKVAKIIKSYSSGPFANSSVLVFGEIANVKFRKKTNDLMFTLDGEWLSLYPFKPPYTVTYQVADFIAI